MNLMKNFKKLNKTQKIVFFGLPAILAFFTVLALKDPLERMFLFDSVMNNTLEDTVYSSDISTELVLSPNLALTGVSEAVSGDLAIMEENGFTGLSEGISGKFMLNFVSSYESDGNIKASSSYIAKSFTSDKEWAENLVKGYIGEPLSIYTSVGDLKTGETTITHDGISETDYIETSLSSGKDLKDIIKILKANTPKENIVISRSGNTITMVFDTPITEELIDDISENVSSPDIINNSKKLLALYKEDLIINTVVVFEGLPKGKYRITAFNEDVKFDVPVNVAYDDLVRIGVFKESDIYDFTISGNISGYLNSTNAFRYEKAVF